MLRQKFIVILGIMTTLLVGMAVVSLWPLNAVFDQLDHIENQATKMVQATNTLNLSISTIEVELYKLRAGNTHELDTLIEAVERMQTCGQELDTMYLLKEAQTRQLYDACHAEMLKFMEAVGALATTPDPQLRAQYNIQALSVAATLRARANDLATHVQQHAHDEQAELTRYFRWMVIGIALGFMVVINICVMVMIRAAQIVLRPVAQLVQASQELAKENFDYRVSLDSRDEFGDLARAYNDLAAQLQENEQRRIEVMGQMALTLNHELNNAMAIIEMQLALMKRRSHGDDEFEKRLGQIRESLTRMSEIVGSLRRIRRIVLTEYGSGQMMLDLKRSTEDAVEPMTSTI